MKKIKDLLKAAQCLWVPLVTALIAGIIFSSVGVDQTREIYRSFAQNQDKLKICLSTFFVFLLSLFVWYSACSLSYKSELSIGERGNDNFQDDSVSRNKETENGTNDDKYIRNIKLIYFPIIFSLFPLIGLGFGIFSTMEIEISLKSKDLLGLWFFCILALLLFLLLILIFILSFLRRALSSKDGGLFSENVENLLANLMFISFAGLTLPLVGYLCSPRPLGVLSVFILCIILNIVLLGLNPDKRNCILGLFFVSLSLSLVFLWLDPVLVPEFLGSISIAALALTYITFFFTTIYSWGQRYELPAVSIIIVFALIFSWLNLNDNHQIRHFERSVDSAQLELQSITEKFEKWLLARKDFKDFKLASSGDNKKTYPVYIVSAEGGGIFAAYHAAITLSRLTDKVTDFPQHVFAISSVSGGSVGATAYSSLIKMNVDSNKCDYQDDKEKTIECAAHKLLGRDFLSPILAMAFYPDFIQRFIPLPINDWDRARGLEIALEESWDELNQDTDSTQYTDNPLKKGYSGFWLPDDDAPALVLNTTIVETGERLVFSPFEFDTQAKIFNFKKANFDIPLSATAFLSARFPIVTPVGWIDAGIKDKNKFRLADGGYFDNSGVVTAIDITRALKEYDFLSKLEKKYGIKIKIINLAIIDTVDENPGSSRGQGLNELLSPVRALLNVRETREETTVRRAESSLNNGTRNISKYQFRTFLLNTKVAHLPLGWLLSHTSQKEIREQIGTFDGCKEKHFKKDFKDFYNNKEDIIKHNNCVAELIRKDLM